MRKVAIFKLLQFLGVEGLDVIAIHQLIVLVMPPLMQVF